MRLMGNGSKCVGLFILFAVLFLPGVGYPQPVPDNRVSIAVLDFSVTGEVDKAFAEAFSQKFNSELVGSNQFRVVDRKSVSKILKEQEFQLSEIVDPGSAADVGKILGVQKIVIGSFVKAGNAFYVTAQMINVKTALVEQTSDITCECVQDLGTLLQAAGILSKKLTGEKQSVEPLKERPATKADLELEKAIKFRNKGKWLTIGALGLMGVGTLAIQTSPPSPNAQLETGYYMEVVGVVALVSGIPIWVIGSSRVGKIEEKKGRISPSFYFSPILDEDKRGLMVTIRH